MSSFADDLARFTVKVEAKTQAVFVGVVASAKASITDGSAITASPGQPVDTGNLKASWQAQFESKTVALISTNVEYAEAVEDAIGPHGPRAYGKERSNTSTGSQVGGSHSVRLTIAGLPLIVADEARKVAT